LIALLTSDPKLEGLNPAPVGTELMKMADTNTLFLIRLQTAATYLRLLQAEADSDRQRQEVINDFSHRSDYNPLKSVTRGSIFNHVRPFYEEL
jgi:hypothetical protein